jgi:hypothetical protein
MISVLDTLSIVQSFQIIKFKSNLKIIISISVLDPSTIF